MTIAFHYLAPSNALEARAHELGRQLEHLNRGILECHVTLEGPHSDSEAGVLFLAKIELSVPGAQICADSMHSGSVGHPDILLAMEDAFDNAKRQLDSLPRDMRTFRHLQ